MSRVLLLETVRQKLLQPFTLAVSLATVAICVGVTVAEKADTSPEILPVFLPMAAIVFASGIVGKDIQNGSMQLLLARPITRSRLLASRLAGVLAALLLLCLIPWALSMLAALALGGDVDIAAGSVQILRAFLQAIWFAVLLAALSAIVPGHRDTLILVLLFLAAGLLVDAGIRLQLQWLASAGQWLGQQVFGTVPFSSWDVGDWPWKAILRYGSNLAVALAFGFWAFNQREVGYGRE